MAVKNNDKPRYTAEEFFKMIPETDIKVELINGEIVSDYPLDDLIKGIPAPEMFAGPTAEHQSVVVGLSYEFVSYIRRNKGRCRSFVSPLDVVLNDYTVFQPDVFIVCDPGKIKGNKVEGAPDLVVEVLSPGSKKRDIVDKYNAYSNGGVREYWIVDPIKKVTVVYQFGDTVDISFYPFDKPVPVGIWGNEHTVNISEMLDEG